MFDFDDFMGTGFPDFDEIEKMFEEMTRGMMDDRKWKHAKPGNPLVYGWSMQMGTDGKPHFEEFGNVSTKAPDKVNDEREPLVEVINAEKEITLIAELPGVEKEKLHLNVDKNSVSITVNDPQRSYKKQLKLPAEVDETSAKAKLKNGILEVVLRKLKPSPPEKAKDVKIEG